MDRLNHTLKDWVRAADRAATGRAALTGLNRKLVGGNLWRAVQSCHCLTRPGWFPYFMGIARTADLIASSVGKAVSEQVLHQIVQSYNEAVMAYNAVETASAFLPRSRVVLVGLDSGSFEHWLASILSDLRDALSPHLRSLKDGSGRDHIFEASVRALWIAERSQMSLVRISRMSCGHTRPCPSLEARRDRLVKLLGQAAKSCREAARVGLLQGADASGMQTCLNSWKRLDARVARTGKDPSR